MLSINERAQSIVENLCKTSEENSVIVKRSESGATLIDAGIEARGGFTAGRIITEICLGGLGSVQIYSQSYDAVDFMSIFILTDQHAIATLGSQFAGWQIKKDRYFAIGSGPARALAQKPREIYDILKYHDKPSVATIVLETTKEPPEWVIQYIAHECNLSPDKLNIILTPTTSVAGSTQVSGRIVETGLHKLSKLGINPLTVHYGSGHAPIAPVHPKFTKAMGLTNDVILYGGVAYYALEHDNDQELEKLLKKAPSSASKQYGKPFAQIFKEANYDFYKIDPNLFSPAKLIINNITTGSNFHTGHVNFEILQQSLKMIEV
jgi:methenyltetrahydromethanopterin cyclohydrolase